MIELNQEDFINVGLLKTQEEKTEILTAIEPIDETDKEKLKDERNKTIDKYSDKSYIEKLFGDLESFKTLIIVLMIGVLLVLLFTILR